MELVRSSEYSEETPDTSAADFAERHSEARVYWLLGLPFDCIDLNGACDVIRNSAQHRRRLIFATPNLSFLRMASEKPEFRRDVLRTNFSVVDGMPLVWAGRLLGIPFPERVAGSELMERLSRTPTDAPVSVFFFGGEDGAAEAASSAVKESLAGISLAGYLNPGFGTIEDMSSTTIIDQINASGADFLCVSLGAAKGHAWIERNRNRLKIPQMSHLGAVVNFLAGTVKRAPRFMQVTGLEWLWRMWQEPRLARRYLKDGIFLMRQMLTAILPLLVVRTLARIRRQELVVSSKETDEGRVNLVLSGSLDYRSLPKLRERLAVHGGDKPMSIDLSAVTHIDCEALGLLYSMAYRQARDIEFVGGNRRLTRLLRLHRAADLFAGDANPHAADVAPDVRSEARSV